MVKLEEEPHTSGFMPAPSGSPPSRQSPFEPVSILAAHVRPDQAQPHEHLMNGSPEKPLSGEHTSVVTGGTSSVPEISHGHVTKEVDLSDLETWLDTRIDTLLIQHLGELRSHLDGQFKVQKEAIEGLSDQPVHAYSSLRQYHSWRLEEVQLASNGSKKFRDERNSFSEQKGLEGSPRSPVGKDEDTEKKRKRRFTQNENEKRIAALQMEKHSSIGSLGNNDHPFWVRARQVLKSNNFEYTIGLLILSNAIFIGVQVEYRATTMESELPPTLIGFQYAYTAVFTLELMVRFVVEGCRKFFCSEDGQGWNIVDFTIVLVSLVEIPAKMFFKGAAGTNLTVLRLIRILRIVRVMRIIRVMRFFRPLRVLLLAIASTLKSAVWTLSLLCLILFGFGIVFAQGAVDHLLEQGVTDSTFVLHMHWGTLARSVFTLFKAISGGIDWQDAVRPLDDLPGGPAYVAFFIFYMAFVQIAVMNVVTGIFVSTAMESAQKDSDVIIAEQKSATKQYAKQLQQVMGLKGIQRRNSGRLLTSKTSNDLEGAVISLQDFEEKLSDDKVRSFFDALEIDTSDAWNLFKILDRQGTGQMKVEDFVERCMQLRGPAKNAQLENLQYESKHLRNMIMDFMDGVEERYEDFDRKNSSILQRLLQQSEDTKKQVQAPPVPKPGPNPAKIPLEIHGQPASPSNDEAPWMLTACCSPMKRPPKTTPIGAAPSTTSIWSNPFFGGSEGLICGLPASRSTPRDRMKIQK